MLSDEFKKDRAREVSELAGKAIDPFIKQRLLKLAGKYEGDERPHRTTPLDLEFVVQGTGPER
jgi:hypothetical protein